MSAGRVILLMFGLALAPLLYFALRPVLDRAACESEVLPSPELIGLVEQYSESRTRAEAAARGLTTTGSWTDWQSRYDVLSSPAASGILMDPSRHLAEARRIVESDRFDETQKMIVVLVMQRLPVGRYVCFMDSVNRAIESGAIKDKRITVQALMPDAALRSSALGYWWHPIWRQAFRRSASQVLSNEQVQRVLGGRHWLSSL